MPRAPLEQLYGPIFRGIPRLKTGGAAAFAGRTTIASGSVSAAVATTLAASDSIIGLTVETGVASLNLTSVIVSSINPGTGFTIGLVNGTTMPKDIAVHWRLYGTS